MEYLAYDAGICLYPTSFWALCSQPESIPGTLIARMAQFSLRDPYRLPVWLGQAIYMLGNKIVQSQTPHDVHAYHGDYDRF